MVDDHFRGEKIVVFKYKPKKRYRRRIGHRQALTHLTITGSTPSRTSQEPVVVAMKRPY